MMKEKKNYSDFCSLYTCFLLLFLSVEFARAQSGNGTPANEPYEFKPRFNPSMAIITIVLISAFFFMGFFSIYIHHCAEREAGNVRSAIAGIGRSQQGPRGLDPTVIETFPVFVYSEVKGLKIGKGTLECAVCLNEFEDDETLRLLPKCDHVFHPECIDAWLVSHTTCPVCRDNLVPESGDSVLVDVEIPHPEAESIEENRGSEIDNSQNQVPIRVIEEQKLPEVVNPAQILNQNRRSRSSRFKFTGKFPRSHSTGHSLIRRGENCERFTLRLPVDVRKQIMNKKLNRTTSCVVFPTEGSSRRGYRSAGEGSSQGKLNQFVALDRSTRSDRWTFSMTPPFFTRSASARSTFKSTVADGEQTVTPKGFFPAVKTPFDCLSNKVDGSEQCSRRLV